MNLSEDITKKKIFSQWTYIAGSILFAVITLHFYIFYGTVHWGIMTRTYQLHGHINDLIKIKHETPCIKTEEVEKIISSMENSAESLTSTPWILKYGAVAFHFSGVISFLLSMLSFREKPRWVGIISLPFGICGLIMSMLVM